MNRTYSNTEDREYRQKGDLRKKKKKDFRNKTTVCLITVFTKGHAAELTIKTTTTKT